MSKEKKCPHYKKPCLEHGCTHYQKLRGHNPQTGEPIDEYQCAELWTNILLIENAQMGRQTGAAVESFRNEMVKGNNTLANVLQIGIQHGKK